MLREQEVLDALTAYHGTEVQNILLAASVGIAGLGGLGSNIAVQLARLGVGRLVLCDFDVVELSNLNRQYYTTRDIGKLKTEALVDQLMKINPYLCYVSHNVRITPENASLLFNGCSVVCEALDEASQKAMLVETLMSELPELPIVSGNGMAGFDSINQIKTRRAMRKLYICGDEISDAKQENAALAAPRVLACAAQQANMAVRLLLGKTDP